jgi:glutamate dehydrogenase/leucine dehydrogenase
VTTGPVQVLVVGFDEPHFDGSVLSELTRLGAAGVVRLVDLLVVRRADDGSLEIVEGYFDGHGEVAAALLERAHEEGSDVGAAETWSLADVVPSQGLAVVALIEHLWAGPLSAALHAAGATLLEETWLSEDDRTLLGRLASRDPQ